MEDEVRSPKAVNPSKGWLVVRRKGLGPGAVAVQVRVSGQAGAIGYLALGAKSPCLSGTCTCSALLPWALWDSLACGPWDKI